jgi:hypothetical protein
MNINVIAGIAIVVVCLLVFCVDWGNDYYFGLAIDKEDPNKYLFDFFKKKIDLFPEKQLFYIVPFKDESLEKWALANFPTQVITNDILIVSLEQMKRNLGLENDGTQMVINKLANLNTQKDSRVLYVFDPGFFRDSGKLIPPFYKGGMAWLNFGHNKI